MPYIKRSSDGAIVSLSHISDELHQEQISATSTEIVEYLSKQKEMELSKHALAESDKDIARVTEDLINLLISKNIILFTELPQAVQEKLLGREKLRSSLSGVMDNFLDDDESI